MKVFEKAMEYAEDFDLLVIVRNDKKKQEVRFITTEIPRIMKISQHPINPWLYEEVELFRYSPIRLELEIIIKEQPLQNPQLQIMEKECCSSNIRKKSVDPYNITAEFACKVCRKRSREEYPNAIDCAWRGIDNEYCQELLEALEEFQHENRN
jgi:hypothetical protein